MKGSFFSLVSLAGRTRACAVFSMPGGRANAESSVRGRSAGFKGNIPGVFAGVVIVVLFERNILVLYFKF